MIFFVVKLLILILFIANVFGQDDPSKVDWCSADLGCKKQKNYACDKCPLSEGCEILKDVMTVEFRKDVLKAHNELRNKVALGEESRVPSEYLKAADMHALSYDSNLEYLAECWLRQCKFKHTTCQKIPGFISVGQNLFTGTQCKPQEIIDGFKKGWYEREIENTDLEAYKGYKPNAEGKAIGHYTQMIWAKTQRIGCSVSLKKNENVCILACNYARAGNLIGSAIYEQGDPATKCDNLHVNENYKGLCGKVKEYNNAVWKFQENIKNSTNNSSEDNKNTVDNNNPDNIPEKKSKENVVDNEDNEANNTFTNQTGNNKKKGRKANPYNLTSLELPWMPEGGVPEEYTTIKVEPLLDLPWRAYEPVDAENETKQYTTPPMLELPWIERHTIPLEIYEKDLPKITGLPWVMLLHEEINRENMEPPNLPQLDDLPWRKDNNSEENSNVTIALPKLKFPWSWSSTEGFELKSENDTESVQESLQNKTETENDIPNN